MPYDISWLDDTQGIVSIRMLDPLRSEDISGMRDELMPTLDTGRPLYLLVDIRQFNILTALGMLGTSDGLPIPNLPADQASRSRMAIVGGGATVNLLLKMVDDDDSGQIRPFTQEDVAYSWLLEAATSNQNSET